MLFLFYNETIEYRFNETVVFKVLLCLPEMTSFEVMLKSNIGSTFDSFTIIWVTNALDFLPSTISSTILVDNHKLIWWWNTFTWLKSEGSASSNTTAYIALWISSKCCSWSGWMLIRYSRNCKKNKHIRKTTAGTAYFNHW